jgi:Fe2+ transport system protein B
LWLWNSQKFEFEAQPEGNQQYLVKKEQQGRQKRQRPVTKEKRPEAIKNQRPKSRRSRQRFYRRKEQEKQQEKQGEQEQFEEQLEKEQARLSAIVDDRIKAAYDFVADPTKSRRHNLSILVANQLSRIFFLPALRTLLATISVLFVYHLLLFSAHYLA